MEVYPRESYKQFDNWLPDETVEAFARTSWASRPLTTPVGGASDLDVLATIARPVVCLRPVRWYKGLPRRSSIRNAWTW